MSALYCVCSLFTGSNAVAVNDKVASALALRMCLQARCREGPKHEGSLHGDPAAFSPTIAVIHVRFIPIPVDVVTAASRAGDIAIPFARPALTRTLRR